MWAAVFGLALLSTAFAYLLYFTIIARAGATNASLVTLIVPVSAILLGALFLGERLELFEFAGMALIAVGLLTIDGRLLQAPSGNRTAVRLSFLHRPRRAIFVSKIKPEGEKSVSDFPTIMSHCSNSFRLPEPGSGIESLLSL